MPDAPAAADEALDAPDRAANTPRWVKALAVAALLVGLLVVGYLLLTGHSIPSHGP
ncbi:MAG TPA: hypothetical protein VGB42_03730 [Candidatus Thermoplasmatota archaeon]